MKIPVISISFLIVIFSFNAVTQTNQTNNGSTNISDNTVNKISDDLTKISKSLTDLNAKIAKFFDSFTSNQGLKLSEKQQRILLTFEILNRAEQRIATLVKFRVDMTEKLSETKIKLAKIEDDLRDENIQKSVALRGSLNANEVREATRNTLNTERNTFRNLLNEIQTNLYGINDEISQTELLVKRLRPKLFSEIEKEFADF